MSPGRPQVRRVVFVSCCVAVLWAAAATGSAAERFFSVIEDLPLMPALKEVPHSAVIFSKAQGRIVEVVAQGPVTREAVLGFYGRTLPQLGWHGAGAQGWRRDGETLQIGFRPVRDGLLVQFSIAPR